MLAFWAAHNNGFDVKAEQVERAMNWFLRVQDARSGGWAYSPKDRGQRVNQGGSTPGMTAAGLGSIYVGAHLLGMTATTEKKRQAQSGRPAALTAVKDKAKKATRIKKLTPTKTNAAAVKAAQLAGEAWFANGGWRFQQETWKYYYIYALERCMSFREHVTGNFEAEPNWYNSGVAFLESKQATDGSWSSNTGPTIGTAFAILFLTRSTQKSLIKVESGRVRGGKFLPADLSKIMVDDKGKVADTTKIPPLAALLDALDKVDFEKIDTSIPLQLKLSTNPAKRANELVRLRRMVMNGAYQARLTAVKTISLDRNIDNIPVLIYALSDPDYRVVRAAEIGLRYISRRVRGFGLTVGEEALSESQLRVARGNWEDWYRSFRPDGALIE
jgi:5-hydroxyisourate hydrolase-like protein (transthyretin family)